MNQSYGISPWAGIFLPWSRWLTASLLKDAFWIGSAGQAYTTERTGAVMSTRLNTLRWMLSIEAIWHPTGIGCDAPRASILTVWGNLSGLKHAFLTELPVKRAVVVPIGHMTK